MSTPEAIKKLREAKGWSQQQLAERLGVDQATVSRMENGVEPRGPAKILLDLLMADSDAAPATEDAA